MGALTCKTLNKERSKRKNNKEVPHINKNLKIYKDDDDFYEQISQPGDKLPSASSGSSESHELSVTDEVLLDNDNDDHNFYETMSYYVCELPSASSGSSESHELSVTDEVLLDNDNNDHDFYETMSYDVCETPNVSSGSSDSPECSVTAEVLLDNDDNDDYDDNNDYETVSYPVDESHVIGCRSSQCSSNSCDSGVDAISPKTHRRLRNKALSNEDLDMQCTCDSNYMEENKNKYVEYMVKVYRPLICDTIRADEVSGHMHFIDRQVKSRNDPKELLTLIEQSQEPGKWRTFLDALKTTENMFIYKLITGKTEKDHLHDRRVLRLFTEELKKNITISRLVDYLYEKGAINELDKQNIEAVNRSEGELKATDMLLDRIPMRCVDWNRIFVDGLRVSKHPEMADILQDFLLSEKETQEKDKMKYTRIPDTFDQASSMSVTTTTHNPVATCSTDETHVKTCYDELPRNTAVGKNSPTTMQNMERRKRMSENAALNHTASTRQAVRQTPIQELNPELNFSAIPCDDTGSRDQMIEEYYGDLNHTASTRQAFRQTPIQELNPELNFSAIPCDDTGARDQMIEEDLNSSKDFTSDNKEPSQSRTLVGSCNEGGYVEIISDAAYKRWVYVSEREAVLLKELNDVQTEKQELDHQYGFASQGVEKYIRILKLTHESELSTGNNKTYTDNECLFLRSDTETAHAYINTEMKSSMQ